MGAVVEISGMKDKSAAYLNSIEKWYSGSRNYDFSQLRLQLDAIEFMQLVWKSNEKVGLGVAKVNKGPNKGFWIVAAFFTPPAKVLNGYHNNVQPPKFITS